MSQWTVLLLLLLLTLIGLQSTVPFIASKWTVSQHDNACIRQRPTNISIHWSWTLTNLTYLDCFQRNCWITTESPYNIKYVIIPPDVTYISHVPAMIELYCFSVSINYISIVWKFKVTRLKLNKEIKTITLQTIYPWNCLNNKIEQQKTTELA